MDIYLLRHAQCEANVTNLLAVDAFNPLTTLGLKQAKTIVPALKNLHIDLVLCSTMGRARDTISPFLDNADKKVIYSELLAEGQLVLERPESSHKSPTYIDSEFGLIPSPEETQVEFVKRAEQAIDLIYNSKVKRILVVSHGHMIRELLNCIIGNRENRIRFPHENCGLTSISIEDSCTINFTNKSLG